MDLIKTQGRQQLPAATENKDKLESEPNPVTSDNLVDLTYALDEQGITEETRSLYALRNKTIRCTLFEQHRAYLKCPECPEYAKCTQLKVEQRLELETSPFFSIKELVWEGPRRIKTMYIAVCTDGSLRRLENFDPKTNDGMNLDEFKDVEEVLVVTKAFRRKVIWAPVSLEQVKANQGNGGSIKEPENLVNKDENSPAANQKGRKGAVKAKNGKRN